MDKWSENRIWKYVVLAIGVLYISAVVIVNFQSQPFFKLSHFDLPVTTIVMIIIMIYVTWDFERRDMKFAGYLIGLLIMSKIILQFSISSVHPLGGDKFKHVNTTILFPAMLEAVIAITIAFNWINGIRFKSLAKIYSSDAVTDTAVQQYFDKKRTKEDLISIWKKQIIKNDVEGAIESMVLFLEKRNEHFELILSIASRNNRNNTGQMKGIRSSEEYNRSRNKIIESLLKLLGKI